MSGVETAPEIVVRRPRAPAKVAAAPRARRGRVARYLIGNGITHLALLTMACLFLFPFAWMFATSIKTDEELMQPGLWPAMPTFRADSPYVRRPVTPTKPAQVPNEKWRDELPRLENLARRAIDPAVKSAPVADVEAYKTSAASVLNDTIISKLGISTWSKDSGALEQAFVQFITADEVSHALDEALARLEIFDVQVRSLDARIFKIPNRWSVGSGDARFSSERVSYRFPSSSAGAIVLQCTFEMPIEMSQLHRLIVSLKADDSWNQVDATLDVAGVHWVSQRTTYLAQNRAMSIVFQPPTFDDQTMRQKLWVPLKDEGRAAIRGNEAVLKLMIRPSSTLGTIWGKIQRNYSRAFYAMPFWAYVRNSVILVVLTTVGYLFSSTFVAYGFARLNWPGRTTAFVILLCTMMIPAQVTMIPAFLIWRKLGWYNTLNPLWVPAFAGSAFFIFLMVQHMKTVPRELEESARIDGLNALQIWYYIMLPQVKPAAAAIAIMSFMGSWNEFMGPLIYLRDQARFPLSLGLFSLRLESLGDWSLIMAGNVLMTLPVIVIFFLCQRYFIEGVTMSGLKT